MTAERDSNSELPLSALLSRTLVAFTIEFDNEAERLIQHRTSDHGGTRGAVWLVSMAMYLNCMRFVGSDPITVGELALLARCDTNLAGMQRWGYITVGPDAAGGRAKPRNADLLVRATERGIRARDLWQPLTGVVEHRWRDRYGAAEMSRLTAALQTISGVLPADLPDCLPILGYGLFSAGSRPGEDRYGLRPAAIGQLTAAASESQQPGKTPGTDSGDAILPLPWLLARVLLALAAEFELATELSLATVADVLRLLDESGVRMKDLPVRSGVSVESITMATGYLSKRGLISIGPGEPGERWKLARLTSKGGQMRSASLRTLASIENQWPARYGTAALETLRDELELLAAPDEVAQSPLALATEPSPDGWRAAVRRPVALPHYPMVLHRGGYPDGS